MMELDRQKIRTYSLLGSHRTFGQVALELPKINENVVVMVADQMSPAGLEYFRDQQSDRFINIGIAEQNLIGVASGMAKEGMTPFALAQATFATGRCFDQIKINMAYMQLGVKVVGLSAGLSIGQYGATHMSVEDVSLMRSLPNIVVLSPADCTETAKALMAAAVDPRPTYIRLSGWMNCPIVYKKDYDYQIGEAITLKEGEDIAIIATGPMVYNALKAADMLAEEGLSVKVVDMHTIKPLDTEAINACLNAKMIVTAEEHSVIGGLGSAVAEHLAPLAVRPPQLIIGTNDKYIKAGDYLYLQKQFGLTPIQIKDNILSNYKSI